MKKRKNLEFFRTKKLSKMNNTLRMKVTKKI